MTSSALDRLVAEKDYPALRQALPLLKSTATERDYFQAILDDREHRVAEAVALLEKTLPALSKNNPHRAAEALAALATDYFEEGRYGESADAYARLLKEYRRQVTPGDLSRFTDNLHTYELLRAAPRPAIAGAKSCTVTAHRDPIGDIDVPVKVGTTEMEWIFDTGANLTTISLGTAKQLGLTLSKSQAQTQSGATGQEVPLWTAVIPELHLGGAIVHNAAALVMEDKDLDINLGKNGHYQIRGILGYPVLNQLGSFAFSGEQLTVAPQTPLSPNCTPMYVEQLDVLLQANVNGRNLLFIFDTGDTSASLTGKYLRGFPQQFASLKPARIGAAGAGGKSFLIAYHLPLLAVRLGAATATLHNITVLTRELGTGVDDEVYGNFGQALLQQFTGYTIDFGQMRLCVEQKRK